MSAIEKWWTSLEAMAVPPEVLEAASESPWDLPVGLFRRRAEAALSEPASPARERAEEALPESGVVLDVGVGVGAASLPLHEKASLIVGVDASEEMLEAFQALAGRVGAKVETILGAWQDIEQQAPVADVVVSHHVLYNVPDLLQFVPALSRHARRRVVIEITRRHPLGWSSDLWKHFHGFDRPPGPTSDDAWAALQELGLAVSRVDYERKRPAAGSKEDVVFGIRKRLCLPPERDPEIVEVLGDRLAHHDGGWSAGPSTTQALTAFWWDTA